MSSTELLDAASISITSSDVALAIATQDWHWPQGLTVGPCSQFRHAARILAIDVLPVPREPTNRYAWCTLPCSTALRSVRTTCSWPTTSAKVRGRWRRYSEGPEDTRGSSLVRDPVTVDPVVTSACDCSKEVLEFLRETTERYAAQDVDSLAELLTEDVVFADHRPLATHDTSGLEEMKALLRTTYEML